jgi:hypothetical protein
MMALLLFEAALIIETVVCRGTGGGHPRSEDVVEPPAASRAAPTTNWKTRPTIANSSSSQPVSRRAGVYCAALVAVVATTMMEEDGSDRVADCCRGDGLRWTTIVTVGCNCKYGGAKNAGYTLSYSNAIQFIL